jgi:hypothetical protein
MAKNNAHIEPHIIPGKSGMDWMSQGFVQGLMQLDNIIRLEMKENVTTKAIREEIQFLIGEFPRDKDKK